ncbi:hypothetical protein BN1723_015183 [Verticillium longisporum]|uniref:Uncharacterized protein n=2 Tax=Verticillium TaxID=1036719 RepID=A0A0G4MTK4_VERLO|nr:Proteasome component C5 [Verticillium dahliae VDG2]KAG7118501.1 hypothetical protein HYQ44_005644 [Verticillium longisporum]PNH29436.1 hypothetical protein BJF96_g7225 [Verticillium dahliae]PNH54556.1 hypothetical protein VD0003_g2960 [Verticillium dahliae]PNH65926.1 hypothetical protein VD0002_g3239 [Verticillium dahliae]
MNAPSQSSSSSSSSTQQSPAATMAPPPAPLAGQAPSTDAFLRDFTLVAEAAKRAQMAVMMRDFESVGLS